MTTRRRFLAVLAFGAGGALAGGLWLFRPERMIRSIVRRRLPYVEASGADLDAFVRDYLDRNPFRWNHFWRFALLIEAGYRAPRFLAAGTRVYLEDVQRQVASAFLMSSDFFAVPHEARPVRVRYAGSLSLPCANPFARLGAG